MMLLYMKRFKDGFTSGLQTNALNGKRNSWAHCTPSLQHIISSMSVVSLLVLDILAKEKHEREESQEG
jgi:hypothetical protein